MLDILIYVAILVIIILVVYYLVTQLTLPEPLNKIVMIALVVIGAVVVIGLLMQFTGTGPPLRLPR